MIPVLHGINYIYVLLTSLHTIEKLSISYVYLKGGVGTYHVVVTMQLYTV